MRSAVSFHALLSATVQFLDQRHLGRWWYFYLKLPRDYLGTELIGLLLVYLSIFPYTKYTTATLVIIKTMNGNGK